MEENEGAVDAIIDHQFIDATRDDRSRRLREIGQRTWRLRVMGPRRGCRQDGEENSRQQSQRSNVHGCSPSLSKTIVRVGKRRPTAWPNYVSSMATLHGRGMPRVRFERSQPP